MSRVQCSRVPLLASLLIPVLSAGSVQAAAILPTLIDGETYSFIFLTSGEITGDQTLADYESLATSTAAGSDLENKILLEFGLPSVSWTPVLNHNDGTNYGSLNPAYPSSSPHALYNSTGDIVASNYADLWDGAVSAAIFTEDGGDVGSFEQVWTGTSDAGNGSSPLGPGGGTKARIGTEGSFASWISSTTVFKTQPLAIYVVSESLTFVELPEPTSSLLLLVGAAVAGLTGRKPAPARKHRAPLRDDRQ